MGHAELGEVGTPARPGLPAARTAALVAALA